MIHDVKKCNVEIAIFEHGPASPKLGNFHIDRKTNTLYCYDGSDFVEIYTPAEMKVVYIAGMVTGLPYEDVVKKFNKAEELLLDRRFIVMNPTKLIPKDTDWSTALYLCKKILRCCDVIALLSDWDESRGAIVEKEFAEDMNLEIIKLWEPPYLLQ